MTRKRRRASGIKANLAPDFDRGDIEAARQFIARYEGAEHAVLDLMGALEIQSRQVEYLQGEIEKIGKLYPGLFTLAYHSPGDPKAIAMREVQPTPTRPN